jgi:hypothetical protein
LFGEWSNSQINPFSKKQKINQSINQSIKQTNTNEMESELVEFNSFQNKNEIVILNQEK